MLQWGYPDGVASTLSAYPKTSSRAGGPCYSEISELQPVPTSERLGHAESDTPLAAGDQGSFTGQVYAGGHFFGR